MLSRTYCGEIVADFRHCATGKQPTTVRRATPRVSKRMLTGGSQVASRPWDQGSSIATTSVRSLSFTPPGSGRGVQRPVARRTDVAWNQAGPKALCGCPDLTDITSNRLVARPIEEEGTP